MSERVIYKDSETRLSSQAIVKICGWKHVKCDAVNITSDGITAHIHDTRSTSICPCCGRRSSSVHSYYFRQVSDLSIHGKRLTIIVTGRRFRCENPKCDKKTFAAQIKGMTERYSRRTVAAREYLEATLVHVPSTVGALQSTLSRLPVSTSTALRIVYGISPHIEYSSIRNICIDDFASCKGQTYRTLIADADTGLPVEIVQSRDECDVTKALRKYKKVRVASRDRAGGYAKAISKAIPRARQVADRFHLVMNCGEHVESALKHNLQAIRHEVEKYTSSPPAYQACSLYHPPSMEDIELFNKVKGLHARGWSLTRIGIEVGIERHKVKDICNSEAPHGRKITTPKMMLPYISIIDESIKEGKSYKDIRKSILDSGGSVSIDALMLGMKKLYPNYHPRQGIIKAKEHNLACAKNIESRNMRLLASGRMHIYLTNPEYGVNKGTGECSEEHVIAEKLIASSETLLQLRDFHTTFRSILKDGNTENLDKWIEKNAGSKYADLRNFVTSVKRDIKPIKNAITYSISNGLIEGLNNKIKAVKRSMYGRASDRLLWIKMYQTCLAS